ncbi:MAG: alginate export family protein [Sphingomonadaceae bacterium]
MKKHIILGAVFTALASTSALAESFPLGGGIALTPSLDARVRFETVDQDNAVADAEALTVRLRPGISLGSGGFSLLVEGEGTFGIVNHYNDTNAANGVEPYSVVADPESIELNRAQLQYKSKAVTLTAGRQRINIDDQRFVGSVGWRQNEQTFDAVSGEGVLGPVLLSGTYAWSQRTIFGNDAGPRHAFSGDYIFLGAGAGVGPLKMKGFAYLLDFDAKEPIALTSTQTYGVRATTGFKIGEKISLDLAASYARQSDYKANPFSYSADYLAAEVGVGFSGFTLTGGYEKLGADNGRAFQTPMATMHKFNGWADLFLTTPNAGLEDIYGGVSVKLPEVKALPGLTAALIYHDFGSDVGGADYGSEWDAQIGFKLFGTGILLKYADYDADTFGVDTRKIWVQLGWTY